MESLNASPLQNGLPLLWAVLQSYIPGGRGEIPGKPFDAAAEACRLLQLFPNPRLNKQSPSKIQPPNKLCHMGIVPTLF